MLLAQGLELFAQAGNGFRPAGQGGNANAGQGADAGTMMGIMCFYGVVIVIAVIVQIFFLKTLSKCFQQIAPRNRSMEPGQVWLALIPLFGTVWIILTILRLAESLEKEYRSRGLQGDGDFGKQSGLIYIVSSFICGCVAVVFWIIYWMKISGYTKELSSGSGSRRRELDDDESEEDYRERRSKRRDQGPDDDGDPPRGKDDTGDDEYRPRDRR